MKSDRAFTAVALAGGRLEADFRAAGYTVPNKAYLPVGGRTMLERVLRALRGSASIGSIRCVTRADDSKAGFLNIGAPLWDMRIEPGDDLMGSVLAGCAGLHADELVMVCATDIPLLTPTAVDAFASRARHAGCDLGYGCVYRAAHELAYPQIRHTWVTLRDGSFCGAGVSVVRAGEVKKLAAVLREFTAARKSPLRLASLFSPWLALRLLLGSVSIAELELRATSISGIECRAIPCHEPELAVNVDRIGDLRAVQALVDGMQPQPRRA